MAAPQDVGEGGRCFCICHKYARAVWCCHGRCNKDNGNDGKARPHLLNVCKCGRDMLSWRTAAVPASALRDQSPWMQASIEPSASSRGTSAQPMGSHAQSAAEQRG